VAGEEDAGDTTFMMATGRSDCRVRDLPQLSQTESTWKDSDGCWETGGWRLETEIASSSKVRGRGSLGSGCTGMRPPVREEIGGKMPSRLKTEEVVFDVFVEYMPADWTLCPPTVKPVMLEVALSSVMFDWMLGLRLWLSGTTGSISCPKPAATLASWMSAPPRVKNGNG
jgi:hypothetical protein